MSGGTVQRITKDAARRIALAAHGMATPRPRGRIDVRHFRRVMGQLGLIQLDSVNVCVRTHYMPFYARLGAYDREALDTWLNRSGENFEYWAHEAAVLPVDRYPLWRWKMAEMRPWRRAQALLDAHPGLMSDVLGQVRDRGPLTVRELDAPKHRDEPWWGSGPGKVALDVLFAQGDVTAVRTDNFTRLYDMPERMIHREHFAADPVVRDEAFRHLLRSAVRHVGIGTAHDIADYFRLNVPQSRAILTDLTAAGVIREVSVDGWRGPVYLDPDAVRPRAVTGASLLSPFDPVMWNRDRVERLFGFRYRIEIYVPQHKRVFGYYVMPLLLDGELVARVDLKADRKQRRLLVRSAFVEEGADRRRVTAALAEELETFASWLSLHDISVTRKGNLAVALGDAV